MPGPLLAAALSTGGNLVGQGVNALIQGAQNRKQRQWNEKMYKWQRADALADYAMQNEYNSPINQMARLREAGLNPNLVYGNGADAQGGVVRSSQVESYNPRAPQFDVGGAITGGIAAYYDTQVKQATVDNLKVANTVAVQEAILKAAQTIATLTGAKKTGVDTKSAEFDLGLKQELKDVSVQAAQAALQKTQAETEVMLSRNEREATMFAPSLEKAVLEVANMRIKNENDRVVRDEMYARIDNLKKEGILRDLDIQLRKMGINPNDPLYARIIGRLLNLSDKSLDEWKKTDPEVRREVLNQMLNPFNKLVPWKP